MAHADNFCVTTSMGLRWLSWLAAAAVLAALYMSVFYAPTEVVMGAVQRIFYFHISAGWVGGLAFLIAAVSGVCYLIRPRVELDAYGHAAVEIGLMFTIVNIATGSIWARPIWNTWWTWDPRLITASVMAVVYAGYLLLRRSITLPEARGRTSAGYAILSFLSVPLTFLSIRLFRTLHPVVIVQEGGFEALSIKMMITLVICLVAFTLLFAVLMGHRLRLIRLQRKVEELTWAQMRIPEKG